MSKNGTAAGAKARGAKLRAEADEQLDRAANLACEQLDTTACAWVAALRFRLAELIDACVAVSACACDPAGPGPRAGSLHLKTVLDLPRLHRLAQTLEQAEGELNRVLLPDTAATIPDLAAAVRDADDALADRVGIARAPRAAG